MPKKSSGGGSQKFKPPGKYFGGQDDNLMSVDEVQKLLARSRSTIYRYANTDPKGRLLNMPFDPKYLNPEHRANLREPLRFHPSEVARFARDILEIPNVKVETIPPRPDPYVTLLQAILQELKDIRVMLQKQSD